MKREERAAILGSIKKWENIAFSGGHDLGDKNCDLCKYSDHNSFGCRLCPIRRKTGLFGCQLTPYIAWYRHHVCKNGTHTYYPGWKVECPECLKLAKAEIKFLKTLLPKRRKKSGK